MEQKPDTRASDMEAMLPKWQKVRTILDGLASMRRQAKTYLPQLPKETDARYKFRIEVSKLTNVFADIVENLAHRAFAKEVTIKEDTTDSTFDEFIEDVDGRGNSLHVVASESFYDAIAFGVDWILVDYTKNVPQNATVAQERKMGARPYWVRYPVESVRAAYTAMIEGKEQFVHVRLLEHKTVRKGFFETTEKRVLEFNREKEGEAWGGATITVWKEVKGDDGQLKWIIEEPKRPLTIQVIPLVAVLTGRRKGKGWTFKPPMQDAADLQITLFQQETGLEFAKTMSCYPMIAGNGVSPSIGEDGKPEPIETGPGIALYAPNTGEGGSASWEILEPSAASLKFLADDVKNTTKELRELGRQPLTAQSSGNLTKITTSFAASKGNSAIQAWAINASDAYNTAMAYTAMWLKSELRPLVQIDTDFDTSDSEDDGFSHVMSLRKSGDISRDATLHEAKRRSILDKKYDPEADADLILDDLEDGDDETEDEDDDDGIVDP
ncbi:DUF4055 domain-containing protein [Roseovarius sp. MMSF_3281]|uniref:DUF4055 domain-containing protein n=1 Tax=Roseovarius sp. MMSF_3281 TaxID=3046694 RepID=UPI00273F8983|nr:DUF4055 domain-containing protein [Roseovarius sp. MMSF_3281]